MKHSARTIQVKRCRDHRVIANILRRDYFDDPIPRLSDPVIQTFARQWVACRKEMYLLTADVGGNYAGFVLAHTLGSRMWRSFAREHPVHFPALGWAALRMKLDQKVKRPSSHQTNGSQRALQTQLHDLEISSIARPFSWAPEGSGAGIIPLVFVHSDYRGHGLAVHLLEEVSREMFRDGASAIEAHIDLHNISSVRAFRKSGFQVYLTTTKDFLARKLNPLKQSAE
jgi:ribosomal protein S18 acetylase RimI-like enzyme